MREHSLNVVEIEENKKEIISLLRSTHRINIEKVIKYLCESTFFSAWGSYRHHKYKGGLAEHSLNVCKKAIENNRRNDRDSVIICSLLHDICKASSNKLPSKYQYGHGEKSVAIITEYLMVPLSDEEKHAIRFHMTVWGHSLNNEEHKEFDKAQHEDLWLLIHTSDWFDAGGYNKSLFGLAKTIRSLIR